MTTEVLCAEEEDCTLMSASAEEMPVGSLAGEPRWCSANGLQVLHGQRKRLTIS